MKTNFSKLPFFLFGMGLLSLCTFSCKNSTPTDGNADAADSTAVVAPAAKGFLTITTSADLTTADYDKIAAAMTTSGQWTKDWTYNAIGAMQPKGAFSIGLYPSMEAVERRKAIYQDLFPKLGVNAPPPTVYEVYNVIVGTQPANIPAGGFLAHFDGQSMTPAQYDKTLIDLEAAGAGAPAGRLYHICYKTGAVLQVVDLFDNDANFKAFGDKLMPILQANGVASSQPKIYPLHNYVMGN